MGARGGCRSHAALAAIFPHSLLGRRGRLLERAWRAPEVIDAHVDEVAQGVALQRLGPRRQRLPRPAKGRFVPIWALVSSNAGAGQRGGARMPCGDVFEGGTAGREVCGLGRDK